jgi:hypothetical protein
MEDLGGQPETVKAEEGAGKPSDPLHHHAETEHPPATAGNRPHAALKVG